jgi:serine-type D-Ala-D-Ala carboxypeptidase/endopeptidase (penicillin-binding protein 4)
MLGFPGRWMALPVLLVCFAAGCGSRSSQTTSSAVAPASPRVTPSPPPWTDDERSAVAARLRGTFSSPYTANAALVVLADDGTVLFGRRASSAMVPASTLKLLVAATSLDLLGPHRRFDTSFETVDDPDADGTLPSPLWLVGEGDPLLADSDLRGGVGILAHSGIRRISGGVVVDATAFSGPEQNPFWDSADLEYDYAAGTSAVSLNGNVAEFKVYPGEPGDVARVEVRPRSESVSFVGHILTSSAGEDSDVSILRDTSTNESLDRNDFVLGGHVPAGIPQSFYKPVLGIAAFVGGAVEAMLDDRGIMVDGGVRVGAAPLAAKTLWLHHSLPLAALLREMLVFSDNHTAEQLLRIVGFDAGHAGTLASGIRAEHAFLLRNGIATNGMHVVDGSGLSPKDRVTALALARVLRVALRGPAGDDFLHALPLVGKEGTVKRHDVTTALGRARAKSGHIDQVSALAGTVLTAHHGRVTFAFLVNGPYADAGPVDSEVDHALDLLAAS